MYLLLTTYGTSIPIKKNFIVFSNTYLKKRVYDRKFQPHPISLSHGEIMMKVRCPMLAMTEFGLLRQPHKESTAKSGAPILCTYLKRESKILLKTRIELSLFPRASASETIGSCPENLSKFHLTKIQYKSFDL